MAGKFRALATGRSDQERSLTLQRASRTASCRPSVSAVKLFPSWIALTYCQPENANQK